jgi:hypothetical protein
MENSKITYKPVYWRFFLYGYIPFTIGCILGGLISNLITARFHPGWYFSILSVSMGGFLGCLIGVAVEARRFSIVFHENKIKGPSFRQFRHSSETIPLAALSNLTGAQPTFYERISRIRTIRSAYGQKIKFFPFIYGPTAAQEIRRKVDESGVENPPGYDFEE